MEVEHQKQIGDQAGQELKEHAVPVSGDEVIHVEMFFPPGKESFDLPAQREDESDLFGSQVIAIGDHPVDFAPTAETYQVEGMLHLVSFITKEDFGKEEDRSSLVEREFFKDFPLRAFSDARNDVFIQSIK